MEKKIENEKNVEILEIFLEIQAKKKWQRKAPLPLEFFLHRDVLYELDHVKLDVH